MQIERPNSSATGELPQASWVPEPDTVTVRRGWDVRTGDAASQMHARLPRTLRDWPVHLGVAPICGEPLTFTVHGC